MGKAWHFVGDTLRDDRPVPKDGEKLVHDGELVMCESGLHASERIIDALQYASGSTICRVGVGGEILKSDDKLVATERTILWRVDGENLLRKFARLCALDVVHLWDAPDVVLEYLNTGDEKLRDAAWAAGRAVAWDAAWHAVWAALQAPGRDAEWAAAWDAVWAAERDVAQAAARAAARAAAWASGRDDEWVAARAAARAAAGDDQNQRLEQMVREARDD